ncbi:MAG: uracil-DNA glycosylase [Anaerolineales bacterium]|nr:uracil-DNA glycosylase [Anaerolineales bacterium]
MAQAELDVIAAEVRACRRCKLYRGATQGVPGEGPAGAEIMFIGEGPGFHEDQQGRPFVGASGKFLEEMLAGIGLTREQVFIANVVKHRPPNNRDPEPDEIAACAGFLDRQIAAINPLLIVTLGRYSMRKFFPNASISAIHGQPKLVDGRPVVPMFHPAAALHQQSLRQTLLDDFKKLPRFVARARERREDIARGGTGLPPSANATASAATAPAPVPPPTDEPPAPPTQLSLF